MDSRAVTMLDDAPKGWSKMWGDSLQQTLESRCRTLVLDLGLATGDDVVTVQRLTGGVASDIARVTVGDRDFCVKFALAKLRVAVDWFAPVTRNFAEYSWLQAVSSIAPDSALKLYGHSRQENGFAMEFLDGDDVYLLKAALLAGDGRAEEAAAIGRFLGSIHAASTMPTFDQGPFANRDDFHAIRIEPYLVHTARHHPNLAHRFHEMADALYRSGQVLIHGDVSPKNILFRGNIPFILDAECATMGDPCFDLAFCLNHYVLKAVHLPHRAADYLSFCLALWNAYAPYVAWETSAALEGRICRLLPMLMLGRIDGKSPIEYLDDDARRLVAGLAVPLIRQPVPGLAPLLAALEKDLIRP